MNICCCTCCSPLQARYKRLVDNIFPANPQDGLIKSNMEKLTFYALSSPEKLDRIGEYLAQKVARDLYRHRNGSVIIAMDAMDQLLVACHAQTLNLFVESFLKIVQQLLESQEPRMQLLATQSFVKFANIEEDTPSYHRRYDFFVSKFSSLCHNNNSDMETRNMLRMSGLNGLKGVIRKTVGDDLQVDIWDEAHMDKIVPSLLYNMQCQDVTPGFNVTATDATQMSNSPGPIAEECLRELIGRAAFGRVRSVVKPILKHLDEHDLWNARHPSNFAIQAFKIIMYSIQTQHSYSVIQMLMNHLDEKSKMTDNLNTTTKVRTGIVNVLSNIVAISASEAIGPSVLDIINSLLNHLRSSINNYKNVVQADDEKQFQEAVINTLGEFANNFPDYQKIEIMIFILSKAPPTSASSETEILLQHILLKSLLKVSTKYKTVNMTQAFPHAFLNPLLSRSLSTDPKIRLVVQVIFHQLLDRHNNLPKLSKVSLSLPDQLTIEKAHRQDLIFMKKHGPELLLHLHDNSQLSNNSVENFNAIYTTLALICVEMNSEETLNEVLRLTFAMQDVCVSKGSGLSESHKASIHCLVAGFLHLVGHLTAIPAFCSHIEQVIKVRQEKTPWFLPDYREREGAKRLSRGSHDSKMSTPDELPDELLFNKAVIVEALRSTGHDTSKLMAPFMTKNVVDAAMTRSISDLNNITLDVESANSSPGMTRRQPLEEDITFESLRKVLNESADIRKELADMKRIQIVERFRHNAFEDLVARNERRTNQLQHSLNEIFSKFPPLCSPLDRNVRQHKEDKQSDDNIIKDDHQEAEQEEENLLRIICNTSINDTGPPLFAMRFPDLFVY